jgi:hypothetical protein
MLGFLLAVALAPAPRASAQPLNVEAIQQEIVRLQATLRELELQIRNHETTQLESARAAAAVAEVEAFAYAKADESIAQRGLEVHQRHGWTRESLAMAYAEKALSEEAEFSVAGVFIRTLDRLRSYAGFVAQRAADGERLLPELRDAHKRSVAALATHQWRLVAAGFGPDPVVGPWRLILENSQTLLTVRKSPDGRQYLGLIDSSTLQHFPQGAVLFSVIPDLNNPYNYMGVQYGYTAGQRDAREDEPLRMIVHGNTMSYNNRQQRLTWDKIGATLQLGPSPFPPAPGCPAGFPC